VATIIAIVLSPIFGHYNTIFEGLNKLISYIAPPITTVFLFGVFWKKASGRAALTTLIFGGVLGALIFPLDFWKADIAPWLAHHAAWLSPTFAWFSKYVTNDFMLTAFYLLVICSAVMYVGSVVMPESIKEEARPLNWENWRAPLRGHRFSQGIVAGAVLCLFLVLFIVFR
jgi:SSS family solute:Na+ symporter